ncbi:MAG TPA: DUF167 domain-containing protein [Candidatus Limnocylindria bacterium]|nr:DUF167 domain-containing protein [Candidatus Limnocylindria bacterium]
MTARLRVRLQPRAGRDEVVGERDGAVVVRVSAQPIDGRANTALCALIAQIVGVPRGAVRVVQGEKGREKLIEVDGRELGELRRALRL